MVGYFPRNVKNDVDMMAIALFDAFAKAEAHHPMVQYPLSYVATFVDMARAAIATVPHLKGIQEDFIMRNK